jgi:Zn-dependent protease with chaperone function
MGTTPRCIAAFCVSALCAGLAQAQWVDFVKQAIKSVPGVSSPTGQQLAPSEAAVAQAPPAKALKDIESEMAPDVNCTRPRDRFNVAEKLHEFGGAAAQLRLQRLLETDFRYSDLRPEDKQMLRYLAQTTVWLPAEAEAKLGAIHDAATGFFGLTAGPDLGDMARAALDEVQQRLDKLKGVVAEYPAEIRLTVDKKLSDGAFARFGGLVVLSERFLGGLVDAGDGADFLLAHEVSHVYKRHAIKDIQFKLISTSEGWDLARPLLKRAMRGMQIDPLADGVFLFTTMPKLINFVRSVQLRFGREQELEADACSAAWLTAIGRDPVEAWKLYHAALGAASSSYGAEHPSHEEREARFLRRAGVDARPSKAQLTDKGTVKKEGASALADMPKGR